MYLTVQEMEVLCIFHAGTISETLALLHKAQNESHEKIELIKSVAEKLYSMKKGDIVSLAFEPEL